MSRVDDLLELKRAMIVCIGHADDELQGKVDCGCGDAATCSWVLVRKCNLEVVADVDRELAEIADGK